MMNLSLSWTYQRDRVSLLLKFGPNKNNFILKNDNNVEKNDDVKFEIKLDLLERQRFTSC